MELLWYNNVVQRYVNIMSWSATTHKHQVTNINETRHVQRVSFSDLNTITLVTVSAAPHIKDLGKKNLAASHCLSFQLLAPPMLIGIPGGSNAILSTTVALALGLKMCSAWLHSNRRGAIIISYLWHFYLGTAFNIKSCRLHVNVFNKFAFSV